MKGCVNGSLGEETAPLKESSMQVFKVLLGIKEVKLLMQATEDKIEVTA